MARKRKPAVGKKRMRRCTNCTQLFVPDHATRVKQTCPFCGETMLKQLTIRQLEDRAWRLFSRLARYLRADKNGIATCATCNVKKPWQQMDAGHYMSRQYAATKYDWDNVWNQCKPCNSGFGTKHWKPNDSMKQRWRTFLDLELGEGAADDLWRKAMDGGATKPRRSELESMIFQFEMLCEAEGLPTT